jgi:hypothetical protein
LLDIEIPEFKKFEVTISREGSGVQAGVIETCESVGGKEGGDVRDKVEMADDS